MLQLAPDEIVAKKTGSATSNLMNYVNYEGKVVEEHGVALIGWPDSVPFKNPGEIS